MGFFSGVGQRAVGVVTKPVAGVVSAAKLSTIATSRKPRIWHASARPTLSSAITYCAPLTPTTPPYSGICRNGRLSCVKKATRPRQISLHCASQAKLNGVCQNSKSSWFGATSEWTIDQLMVVKGQLLLEDDFVIRRSRDPNYARGRGQGCGAGFLADRCQRPATYCLASCVSMFQAQQLGRRE